MYGFKRIMNGAEPAVIQPVVNGHQLSWNPDDGRFYVHEGSTPDTEIVGTFKDFRNAVYFAKTH